MSMERAFLNATKDPPKECLLSRTKQGERGPSNAVGEDI